MLKFLKNLFKQEEKQEEKIAFDELNGWLDEKEKPFLENLKNEVNGIIDRINEEKKNLLDNVEKLKNTKLQNPNIPNRAKAIMDGNRAAFVKKVSHFFGYIDLKYEDFDEITRKSKELEKNMDSLAKSTARSYQILNEFFAREVASVAENIKKIETNLKEIRNSADYNKISGINKIKNDVADLNNKIKLRGRLSNELENEKKELEDAKNKLSETESKINDIKSGENYKNFENLLLEKEDFEKKLNGIEDRLFHDFSVLEKALKKYAKIAFENGKLIEEYLKNSLSALIKDDDLVIINVLDNLKKAVEENKLGLEQKKSEKTLIKIKGLNKDYFIDYQTNYKKIKEDLDKINLDIKNNEAKNQLDKYEQQLNSIKTNIENINNKILMVKEEIEKINTEKLKDGIREKINKTLNENITLL